MTQGSAPPPWAWVGELADATFVAAVVGADVVGLTEGAVLSAGEVDGEVFETRGTVVVGTALGGCEVAVVGAAVFGAAVVGAAAGDPEAGGVLGDAKKSAVTEIPLSGWLATTRWLPAGVTGTSN